MDNYDDSMTSDASNTEHPSSISSESISRHYSRTKLEAHLDWSSHTAYERRLWFIASQAEVLAPKYRKTTIFLPPSLVSSFMSDSHPDDSSEHHLVSDMDDETGSEYDREAERQQDKDEEECDCLEDSFEDTTTVAPSRYSRSGGTGTALWTDTDIGSMEQEMDAELDWCYTKSIQSELLIGDLVLHYGDDVDEEELEDTRGIFYCIGRKRKRCYSDELDD
ncbi:hypothetical protein OEA41_004102 [Lepraria neglecta]|uniref:Uncharacterized protein n=1 Tax=Lepraria neglecta TaxID=209136 RepID=A0AAE0DM31_9LECA|nr:hypothetical protein OEA41_004102 [Lepraria neglecta]